MSAGDLSAYERGEAGCIKTKESAGSGDGVPEGILLVEYSGSPISNSDGPLRITAEKIVC